MLLFRMVSYLLGHLVILVTGETPEKFVNMAASRGICLWDITRVKDGALLMKVRLSSVRALRHIARRTRCRFRICRRMGLPFYYSRLRRRKALVLGAVFFIGTLYLLSSFVWFIEVKGNERLSAAEILEAAAEAGLVRGAPKWRFDAAGVEAKIQEKFPVVSWAGVYVKGTRVTVEVNERVVPAEEDRRPAHVVAAKAGLVREILVVSGHPAVKEGDTVVPGQVLISGEIPPPEERPEPGEDNKQGRAPKKVQPFRYVHARGIVRARVWYEGYGEAEIVETGRRRTGNYETRVSMKFDGKEIILSGRQNIPFELYEVETVVKRIEAWRNLSSPVEIVTEKFFELEDYREDRGLEGARRLAGERALEAALKQLPKNAAIQERLVEELPAGKTENLARARAVIETVEDIGKEEFFNPTVK